MESLEQLRFTLERKEEELKAQDITTFILNRNMKVLTEEIKVLKKQIAAAEEENKNE